jgi:hypothetical protein
MSLSNYAELKLLDHITGVAAFTQPTIHIALSTTDPLEDGSGITEPSGGSYARKTFSGWASAASREISNSSAIEFVEATGSWGELTHYAIFDASSSGNFLARGAFTEPRTIVSGDTARFLTGQFKFGYVAGAVTTFLANKLLDHMFNVASYSSPTLHMALSTANPTDAGSGLAEPAGGSYARVATSSWSTAASNATSNSANIDFPNATASWGTITHWVLMDASTSGNSLIYASLNTPRLVNNGDTFRISTSTAVITID